MALPSSVENLKQFHVATTSEQTLAREQFVYIIISVPGPTVTSCLGSNLKDAKGSGRFLTTVTFLRLLQARHPSTGKVVN